MIDDMTSFVLNLPNRDGKMITLSAQQVKAAGILLKKTMPDLKAVEHVDSEGKPIKQMIVQFSGAGPTLITHDENSSDIKLVGNDTAE